MKSFAIAALVSVVAADPNPQGLLGGLLGGSDLLGGGNDGQPSASNNGIGQASQGKASQGGQGQGFFGNDGQNFNIELPAGISLNAETDFGPNYPPPPGSINIWHPPHHGVDIDNCDSTDEDDWHYVHPCGDCQTTKTHKWTTSTATATLTRTITDCPETVTDCPASSSVVVTATTTICPVEVTETSEAPETQAPITKTITSPQTTTIPYCDEVAQTMAPPATSKVQPPATSIVQPPTTSIVKPPVNNGTQTMPPMVTGAGARAEAGIVAAVGAAVAFFL